MQQLPRKKKDPHKDGRDDEDDDSDSEDEDEDEDEDADVEPRVIRPVHFNLAFEQVSATVSQDMSSVQQLRRWSDKYSGKKQPPPPPDARKRHDSYGSSSLSSSQSSSTTRVNSYGKGAELPSTNGDVPGITKSSEGMSNISNMPLKTYDINTLLARVGSKLKTEIKPE